MDEKNEFVGKIPFCLIIKECFNSDSHTHIWKDSFGIFFNELYKTGEFHNLVQKVCNMQKVVSGEV